MADNTIIQEKGLKDIFQDLISLKDFIMAIKERINLEDLDDFFVGVKGEY